MITEQLVGMADKLYKCRRAAKTIHGENYATRIEEYKAIIRRLMPLHENDELKTAIDLAHDIKDKGGGVGATILLMAAAVEMIEPE